MEGNVELKKTKFDIKLITNTVKWIFRSYSFRVGDYITIYILYNINNNVLNYIN